MLPYPDSNTPHNNSHHNHRRALYLHFPVYYPGPLSSFTTLKFAVMFYYGLYREDDEATRRTGKFHRVTILISDAGLEIIVFGPAE